MEHAPQQKFAEASLKTGNNLRAIAHSGQVRELSHLSLLEIDEMIDVVAQSAPAGNVPGLILNGLARLAGRRPPANIVKRDVNLLFKGVESALDKAAIGALFAGPAAVIWGYQNLLKLAGKDSQQSFPEGTWQFYADYALREDTARHSLETHGFDTMLKRHNIQLSPTDRITAWVMACAHSLHQYTDLLTNEWRERVYTASLAELTAVSQPTLYHQWQRQRPLQRGTDTDPNHTYAQYRRHHFDQFMAEQTKNLPLPARREWIKQMQTANSDLLAYQAQLSLLAYAEPDAYSETRTSLPLAQTCIGLIHLGRYYLIPICQPDSEQAVEVTAVRNHIATLLSQPSARSSVQLTQLAQLRRAQYADIRGDFNPTLRDGLASLRQAPILLNMEQRPSHLPLSDIRQAERGVGSHPLTIFDTSKTFVFDQSHLFFDGSWGAEFAEILTGEALAWAFYLHTLPTAQSNPTAVRPLALPFAAADRRLIEQATAVTPEVSAESKAIKRPTITKLLKQLRQRNELLNLSSSDLLILYRAIHHATYQPPSHILTQLTKLQKDRRSETAANAAILALQNSQTNTPTLLIPLDASQQTPRERIYPLVLEPPLSELNIIQLHEQTKQSLLAYEKEKGDRTAVYDQFNEAQRTYLATLAHFCQLMQNARQIALTTENNSNQTMKLMAQLPPAIQRLLEKIPSRFDVLNEMIRGNEFFNDIGSTPANSSLTRFNTGKDDSDKKALAWGILTDANGTMHITLRDFRPHVATLIAAGHKRLATDIIQHYLDTYTHGLNSFVTDLQRITRRSRETIVHRE